MGQKPVTLLRDADGKAVGVMVETLDERFALALHTIDNGNKYTWPKAMERLKELGKDSYNKKQGRIIAAYHEEINAVIEEAGGDKLTLEWAVGEYNDDSAWLYGPTLGALFTCNKCGICQVRPLLSSEQIEALIIN